MRTPRVAASTYLNSLPLCYSFLSGSQRNQCDFVGDVAPARCADLLAAGEVDAALIPTIEVQRIPDLVLVPHIAVAAQEEVRSVLLVSRRPLAQARSIVLDQSSRTAAALTQILFRKFFRQEVSFENAPASLEQMLEVADAALLIGDPALKRAHSPGNLRVYDLARLWKNYTGYPFAFAVWAIRRAAIEACASVDFLTARQEGLANLAVMAAERACELELSVPYLLAYLTESIGYELTPEHLHGLNLFYRMALEIGLIDRIVPMNFVEQVRS